MGCKSLTIPGNVTEIGAGAFKYAKFEQVAIPDAVKNIYIETFNHCVNLKNINLGNGVIEIWDDAFSDIADNAEIHIDAVTPPKISKYVFSSNGYKAKVFVPYGTSEDYRSKWKVFSNLEFVEMEPGQTSGVTVGKAPAELHVECNHGCLYATIGYSHLFNIRHFGAFRIRHCQCLTAGRGIFSEIRNRRCENIGAINRND